ncbi:hypothetical protein C7M84_022021, partial [Penaeus vannamei]
MYENRSAELHPGTEGVILDSLYRGEADRLLSEYVSLRDEVGDSSPSETLQAGFRNNRGCIQNINWRPRMRSWTLLVLTAALTASAEKLGNIEVITRDQLGQTLDPPAGGSSFGLPLSSPVQDDVPPPLSYLPPVQTPLPIEPTPVPLPTPIQPETDYLPPVASPVGQPEVETPTGLYNPPTAPAPGTNFPTGTDDYDFDYTDSGDNGQDFLSSIQSVQDSKLALLGSLAGAKASLFQGLRKAKSSIATGVSGALLSKGAGFSSLSQTGSGGSYGSGFSSSYGTDYGTNYGTNPRPVGRPYPSDPYPIYPPYPQPQPQPVYPVPVYPVYRPKP